MKATAHLAGTGGRSVFEERVMAALSRLYADADAQRERRKPWRRVVVLGGAPGFTVLGGNLFAGFVGEQEPVGLLHEFSQVDTGVCTTDDGVPRANWVRRLPMIGIGDTRKVMLSMVDRSYWAQRYGTDRRRRLFSRCFCIASGSARPRVRSCAIRFACYRLLCGVRVRRSCARASRRGRRICRRGWKRSCACPVTAWAI